MSATLKQLRDQIVLDYQITGSEQFPDARLDRLINLAQRYVQLQLNGLGLKKWEKTAALTLASANFAGQTLMQASVPADMLENPRAIRFITTVKQTEGASDVYGQAKELDESVLLKVLLNTYQVPTNTDPVFVRMNNKLYIAPGTIDSADIYYYKIVPDLASDSSATEIPAEFEEFIVKRVGVEVDSIVGKIKDKESAIQEINNQISLTYQKFLGSAQQADSAKMKPGSILQ